MRGLTLDESFHLGRWSRGEYHYRHADEVPPEVAETYFEMVERGCAREVNDRAVTTPMGELALRVDAAVRKAGVV